MLGEEVEPERAKRGALRQALTAEDTAVNASLLILLRAVDRFQAACGRFPGTHEGYTPRPHECSPAPAPARARPSKPCTSLSTILHA